MLAEVRRLVVLLACGCGGAQPPLYAAGTSNDEGHGELARASSRFMTGDRDDEDLFTSSSPGRRAQARARDAAYGGDAYGGAAYGGAGYGGFTVPTWQYPASGRTVRHTQVPGLAGAIEGTITWRGAAPTKPACGASPIGGDGGVADVLVYIEHVQVGRPMPVDQRAASVGGTLMKRGCALLPAIQIATPLPAALSIHGDAKPARLRIVPPTGGPRSAELQDGGRVSVQLAAGITKIDAEDGSLAPAWVLALDTPYYALTDDHGRFRLDELAAGTYEVSIWSAAGGTPALQHRTVRVEAGKPARLDATLGR